MDEWFPHLLLFCGIYIQFSLQWKDAKVLLKKYHPIPGSYERMDKISWMFIIVGLLWALQNLLV